MAENTKKVLFLITKSNFGGAQRYVYDLATSLPKDRFEVVVAFGGTGAVGSAQGRLASMLETAHVRTIYIPELGRDVSPFADIASLQAIIRVLRDERPHVVHLNSSKVGGLGALAGRIAHIPKVIFTAHGWPFREQRPLIAKIAIWILSWMTLLLSHRVICVSESDLITARRMPYGKRRAVRIYNGIGPMQFGSGNVIRDAFPPGVHIVGTIGELTQNKNQRVLIEQARQNPRMYVAIVGEGELRHEFESLIRTYQLDDRVKLFGFLPARDVLRGFDVFALPSLKEGLPYVLLEAKAAQLPIEANRVGGVGEILDTPIEEFVLERMVCETAALYE